MKKRAATLLSLSAAVGVALAVAWWQRPLTSPTAAATSSRLYSISLPGKPHPNDFAETLKANGFVAIPDADFNSVLPVSMRNGEFTSLQAYRRAESQSSNVRFVGYRAGDTSVQLYVQTSGSQEYVQAFQRETEAIHARLSR